MDIAWLQVIIAFILGVIFSAAAKGLLGSLRSKAGV